MEDTDKPSHFAHRIRASARKGWVEVRDYTCREIESKNAFIMALRSAIVPNLTKIKVHRAELLQVSELTRFRRNRSGSGLGLSIMCEYPAR
jgi:hypothetical protein